jgi:enterochelin esterase-like enzyme
MPHFARCRVPNDPEPDAQGHCRAVGWGAVRNASRVRSLDKSRQPAVKRPGRFQPQAFLRVEEGDDAPRTGHQPTTAGAAGKDDTHGAAGGRLNASPLAYPRPGSDDVEATVAPNSRHRKERVSMKSRLWIAPAMVVWALGVCWAQAPADSKPASTNVLNADYPRVHADRSVTFRVSAPDAKKVQILPAPNVFNGLGDGPYDMTNDKGFWTVTIPPAQPGLHNYFVIVDGFGSTDPGSVTRPGYSLECSVVEIPDPNGDFYAVKNVPHGDVRLNWYFSKTTGTWRRVRVYTPPGYEKNLQTRYPVFYLQHGGGESEESWTEQGYANFILDNLIAAGKVVPMIVVMENGMLAMKAGAPEPPRRVDGILLQPARAVTPPPAAGAAPAPAPAAPAGPSWNGAFEEMVVRDYIPWVDATFRTIPDAQHRAVAGLSMGSGQALQLALMHPDLFSYVGAFSGSPRVTNPKTDYGGIFADPAAFAKKIRLLWVGMGTRETRSYPNAKAAVETLNKMGIKAVFFDNPFGHEWQGWRYDFADFAPRLFRP